MGKTSLLPNSECISYSARYSDSDVQLNVDPSKMLFSDDSFTAQNALIEEESSNKIAEVKLL